MKRCKICNEEIDWKAKKCVHCGGYQNWRRIINLGSGISILAAMISIIGAMYPKIEEWIKPSDSKIDIWELHHEDFAQYFAVKNVGSKPGFIIKAEFYSIGDKQDTNRSDLTLESSQEHGIIVIQPGEYKYFYAVNHGNLPSRAESKDDQKGNCYFQFNVAKTKAPPELQRISYPCFKDR